MYSARWLAGITSKEICRTSKFVRCEGEFKVRKSVFLFLAFLLIVVPGCRRDVPVPSEGSPAPDFALTGISGEKVRLSDFRGRVILLNFWASWCPPCREEIPALLSLDKAMAGKRFRMLAVAIDKGGRDTIMKFLGREGLNLPVLLDPDGLVAKTYGITGVPETYIIDKTGTIRKKIIGPLDWSDVSVIRYLDNLTVD
jgi:peroxiredoxin